MQPQNQMPVAKGLNIWEVVANDTAVIFVSPEMLMTLFVRGVGNHMEKVPVSRCGDPEKWLMDFEYRIGGLGGRFVDIYASKLVGNLMCCVRIVR
jgi:hypothetical protein